MFIAVVLVFVSSFALSQAQSTPLPECRDASECRQLALEAKSREDYDLFHDLAWRALQKGRSNDPELMTLVARAQSLSGRPHDALVMLTRLADQKVVTDAATSEDFRRVRELPGWSELEARTTGAPPSSPPPSVSVSKPAVTPAPEKPPASEKPATPEKRPSNEPVVGEPDEAFRFSSAPFTPAGLAYDAVSGRFIVGDRKSRKLSVVGERSHNMTNLASAASAGFQEIAALAIDVREGDLWVVSSADGAASLHKLQLISGRVFFAVQSPKGTSARFADLVVTPQSTVVVLDDVGRRLFRFKPRSKELEVAWVIEAAEPVSVAAPSDSIAYVAHRDGLARIDLNAGHERPVQARDGVELAGLTWIRPYRGGLIAVQRTPEGLFRVVRIAFDGSGATSLTLLDKDVTMASPGAASITDDTLYYLSAPDGAQSTSTIVKRVRLR